MLVSSGIAPLDARLGGIMPGRAHVLSGAPGTGKSLACLEFLDSAIQRGEPAAMLTHDDPADLLAQGEYLGIDLDAALRAEQLVLLRYQLDFARRFARASSPAAAFAELRSLLGSCAPRYLAIDSIAPIVDAGTAAAPGVSALLQFLEDCGSTSLLTFPGDFDGRYDRRLEPLIQRAAAVIHLTAERDRTGVLEVRKARYGHDSVGALRFAIRPGAGLVPLATAQARRAGDVPEETRRRVLVVGDALTDERMHALQSRFDVAVRPASATSTAPSPALAGAVLVRVRRDSVNEALALVRELRARQVTAPIALVTSSSLRAIDRTRALRAGADDFLGAELHPDELLLRVDRLTRLDRTAPAPCVDDAPSLPEGASATSVLDAETFRTVVQSRAASTPLTFFTLVRLTPAVADGEALLTLADTARQQMRVDGGDLAARLDGSVAVYLHSARRKDVPLFVTRMRDVWRSQGGGELDVRTVAYPADDSTLSSVLESLRT